MYIIFSSKYTLLSAVILLLRTFCEGLLWSILLSEEKKFYCVSMSSFYVKKRFVVIKVRFQSILLQALFCKNVDYEHCYVLIETLWWKHNALFIWTFWCTLYMFNWRFIYVTMQKTLSWPTLFSFWKSFLVQIYCWKNTLVHVKINVMF